MNGKTMGRHITDLIITVCLVALMLYFDVIAAEFWPIFTATVVSTVLVLVVTGHVHQWVRKHGVSRK